MPDMSSGNKQVKRRRRQKLVIPKQAPAFNAHSSSKYTNYEQEPKPVLNLPPPSLEPIPVVDPRWRPQQNEPQLRPSPFLQQNSRIQKEAPPAAKRRVPIRSPRSPARKQKMDSSVIRLRTAENFGKILGGEEYGTALEQRIWKAEGNGGRAYANKVREILYALKNNSEIKEKVMKGDISLKRLAKMSTEDLASSELAKKRKQIQQEQLEQIIVKNKHFLGRRGDYMQLLGDRHDIDHEDPEFNRKVDTLDITLDTVVYAPKLESKEKDEEPSASVSKIKISSPTPIVAAPTAPPDLPEVNIMQEDDEGEDESDSDDEPLISSIPTQPVSPLPDIPAPAPPPDFSEMDLDEPPEDVPMDNLEVEETNEDLVEGDKMEGSEEEEEEEEESDDDIRAPDPDDIRAPEPDFEKPSTKPSSANTKEQSQSKNDTPSLRSSFDKEELPGFLRSVNLRELPRSSDVSSPTNPVKSPVLSFADAMNSPSPKPTSPNKRKRKSEGGSIQKRKKQFKPAQLQWHGRLKDRSSKKSFDVKIQYLAGTEMYLKKFIPRSIATNGRIRYANIDNVLPMLKKKSGSKSHLLFKLSSNAKDKSRRREYEKVFEEYESEGRGMVIDMKSEKGFKMYILPPIYDKDDCQIDRQLVQDIWGTDPPEGQPWGYLLYYSKSKK